MSLTREQSHKHNHTYGTGVHLQLQIPVLHRQIDKYAKTTSYKWEATNDDDNDGDNEVKEKQIKLNC